MQSKDLSLKQCFISSLNPIKLWNMGLTSHFSLMLNACICKVLSKIEKKREKERKIKIWCPNGWVGEWTDTYANLNSNFYNNKFELRLNLLMSHIDTKRNVLRQQFKINSDETASHRQKKRKDARRGSQSIKICSSLWTNCNEANLQE